MNEKERITHVRRDNCDRIVEFKTDAGNIYDYETAKEFIINHKIINAEIKRKNGLERITEVDGGHFDNFPPFA